jgi:hypothetical protein
MVKTAVEIVRKFRGIATEPRISPKGEEFPQVTASRKPNGPVYEIKEDTTHRFSHGEKITESEYNSVRKDYDIRMKYWDGNTEHLGKGVFHISGQKREFIKKFLEDRGYLVKELKDHYHVTGKVAWMAMSSEIQEIKGMKFLYVRVMGESGYDRAAKSMKLI